MRIVQFYISLLLYEKFNAKSKKLSFCLKLFLFLLILKSGNQKWILKQVSLSGPENLTSLVIINTGIRTVGLPSNL